MTETDSEKLIARCRMYAATQLMHSAWEMIFDALWDSKESGDLLGVSDRLERLQNDAIELTADMQRDTNKLFQNPPDDEKPTPHNNKKGENHE